MSTILGHIPYTLFWVAFPAACVLSNLSLALKEQPFIMGVPP